jgi:hypothetical protein
VLAAGLLPGQRILEWTILRNGGEREQVWIRSLREQGANLTNLTDGGEGIPGYKFSPEACAKNSAAKMGNKNALGGKSRLGQHASKETLAKRSRALMGNKNALGSKGPVGNKNRLGCRHSEESIAKMMGNKNCLGRRLPEETKLKTSASMRACWARKKATLAETPI